MRKTLVLAAILAATVVLASTTPADALTALPLGNADLVDLFKNPIRFHAVSKTPRQNPVSDRDFDPTGTVFNNFGTGTASGKWTIRGNQFCQTFQSWNNGQEFCWTWSYIGPGVYETTNTPSGTPAFTMTVK